jgi:preprotein translocase subunit SecE
LNFSSALFRKSCNKNKKIKDRKNPEDSSNKALILAFFLFIRVRLPGKQPDIHYGFMVAVKMAVMVVILFFIDSPGINEYFLLKRS